MRRYPIYMLTILGMVSCLCYLGCNNNHSWDQAIDNSGSVQTDADTSKSSQIDPNSNGQKVVDKSPSPSDVYQFANGCYTIMFKDSDAFLGVSGSGYGAVTTSEPFYMKPARLGEYIFYDSDGDYLSVDHSNSDESITRSDILDDNVIWKLSYSESMEGFILQSKPTGMYLSKEFAGELLLAGKISDASCVLFSHESECLPFPEAELNVTLNVDPRDALSRPSPGTAERNYKDRQNIIGFMDSHTHLNHFLGSGETTFVGETFNPLGIQKALQDCSHLHGKNGKNDIFGMAVDGHLTHETSGYPDFDFWPTSYTQTHQQAYYMWIKRSWLAGQRILVQQMVSNEILCKIKRDLPGGKKDVTCNDMEIADIQIQNMVDMQDYIDAQNGGTGKGWFRIVHSSIEAREVIGQGKMAVFLALEFDTVFDAEDDYFEFYRSGKITKAELDSKLKDIENQLDEYYDKGIRSMFIVHAFNNGFGGAQLYKTPVFNLVNKIERGTFYQVEISSNPRVKYQELGIPIFNDDLLENLYPLTSCLPFIPYAKKGEGHSNVIGITQLGEWLLDRMIERKMVVEIDHMSYRMLTDVMDILWEKKYPGIIASHTRVLDLQKGQDAWEKMDIPVMLKILQLGGIVAPMIKDTLTGHQKCVADYQQLMMEGGGRLRNKTYETYDTYTVHPSWYDTNEDPKDDLVLGIPFATDVNGACILPNFDDLPDFQKRIAYDFGTLYDGTYQEDVEITFHRQVTGNRVFDINGDRGMAHYGMMPDLIRKMQLKPDVVSMDALFNSAEAFLRMLERVENYSDTYPSRNDSEWEYH